jgi:uncharacterized RDD family membrane protein YckC
MDNEIQNQNLLSDLYRFQNLHSTSSKNRFWNFAIDSFIFSVPYFNTLSILVLTEQVNQKSTISEDLLDIFIPLLAYAFFMGSQEAIFQGRSIGKFFTGTRAVNQNGSTMSLGKAYLRGLIKAIPFNFLSGLDSNCNPWQDKWTDTIVVDYKKRN